MEHGYNLVSHNMKQQESTIIISFGKVCSQCGFLFFCFSLSSFLTSQLDVVAMFGVPVDATSLLATAILMMAGATKKNGSRLTLVCHQEVGRTRNIAQTEDEGRDL